MSWSVQFFGKPENVAAALEKESEKMSGASKTEYDAALPHIVGLVKQNFGQEGMLLSVTANGHGYIEDGVAKYNNCQVDIKQQWVNLV